MDSDEIAIAGSALLAASLYVVSHYFNRHIDHRHIVARRADGITALWVVIGTGYTLFGAAVGVVLWTHRLPNNAIPLALAILAIHLATFVCSGLPMFVGDMMRRTAQRIAREARRELQD